MNRFIVLSLLVLLTNSCTNKATPNFLPPTGTERKVTDANSSDVFDPKADILFVVDDSGSMDGHQRNLATNVSLFTSVFLQNSVLDYNIGVITTDVDGGGNNCCGRLVGSTRIVTKRVTNADLVLQTNLIVGTVGSGNEQPFASTSLAFSSSLLSSWNVNFLRNEAALIVIFITDAEDHSNILPASLVNQLIALKNGDKRKVLSYGAIIPSNVIDCARDSFGETPRRIEEFLDLIPNGIRGGGLGGNVVNLCDPDFGQKLAEFALQIVDKVGSTIYLSRRPVPGSLFVTYGNSELPMNEKTGWYFVPSLNAVQLGPEIDWASQPPGSKIEVHYTEARGEN